MQNETLGLIEGKRGLCVALKSAKTRVGFAWVGNKVPVKPLRLWRGLVQSSRADLDPTAQKETTVGDMSRLRPSTVLTQNELFSGPRDRDHVVLTCVQICSAHHLEEEVLFAKVGGRVSTINRLCFSWKFSSRCRTREGTCLSL